VKRLALPALGIASLLLPGFTHGKSEILTGCTVVHRAGHYPQLVTINQDKNWVIQSCVVAHKLSGGRWMIYGRAR